MKPTRHLAMPKAPRFVHLDKVSGRLQIPQLRLERLLKTSRFQSFAREKDDAGDWLWLSPDFDEKESLGVESFRQEVIEPLPLGEKARRQFENDFVLAKEEETGAKAFEFFEAYREKRIDDEPVAPRFLELAIEKNFDKATKWREVHERISREITVKIPRGHEMARWMRERGYFECKVTSCSKWSGCNLGIKGYPRKDARLHLSVEDMKEISNRDEVFVAGTRHRVRVETSVEGKSIYLKIAEEDLNVVSC